MRGAEKPQDGQTKLDYVMLRRVGEGCYGAGMGLRSQWRYPWTAYVAYDLKVAVRVVERPPMTNEEFIAEGVRRGLLEADSK